MVQPKLKNEHGMTLVELLAALALFSIVIVLGGSLISSLSSSEKSVSGDISLQQKTNVLMSEMRQAYYSGTGDEKLYMNFDSEKLRIQSLEVSNGEIVYDETTNPYIEKIDYSLPLNIQLTTSSNGENISVNTTLRPSNKVKVVLNKEKTESDNGKSDYEWGEEVDVLPCYHDGNVKWSGKSYENNCKQYNKDEDPYVVNGALLVTKVMHHSKQDQGGRIIVKKDFFAEDDVTLKNGFSIIVDGNGCFEAQVDVKNKATIIIDGNGTFDDLVKMKNKSEIIIKGDGIFRGYVERKENIEIEGNSTFEH